MTVATLQEILTKCDPDAEVEIMYTWGVKLGNFKRFESNDVEVNEDGAPTIILYTENLDGRPNA